jgi:hypothetical protein
VHTHIHARTCKEQLQEVLVSLVHELHQWGELRHVRRAVQCVSRRVVEYESSEWYLKDIYRHTHTHTYTHAYLLLDRERCVGVECPPLLLLLARLTFRSWMVVRDTALCVYPFGSCAVSEKSEVCVCMCVIA